jgi:Tfp pilus assembly protein PilO
MQNDSKKIIKNKYLSAIPYLTSKKSQSFLGMVLTLCTLSFFGFFAISPVVSTIFKLQKEIKDNQYVLEQLETKILNLNELKRQYSNLANDMSVITKVIPTQPYPHIFFAQIRSVAQTSNISINRLQNSEIEIVKYGNAANNDYNSYFFTIEGAGPKENIYKFIKKITNMERIINIDTFSIREGIANAPLNQAIFIVQGTTFFKNDL